VSHFWQAPPQSIAFNIYFQPESFSSRQAFHSWNRLASLLKIRFSIFLSIAIFFAEAAEEMASIALLLVRRLADACSFCIFFSRLRISMAGFRRPLAGICFAFLLRYGFSAGFQPARYFNRTYASGSQCSVPILASLRAALSLIAFAPHMRRIECRPSASGRRQVLSAAARQPRTEAFSRYACAADAFQASQPLRYESIDCRLLRRWQINAVSREYREGFQPMREMISRCCAVRFFVFAGRDARFTPRRRMVFASRFQPRFGFAIVLQPTGFLRLRLPQFASWLTADQLYGWR